MCEGGNERGVGSRNESEGLVGMEMQVRRSTYLLLQVNLHNLFTNLCKADFHEFPYAVHLTCGYYKVFRLVLLEHQPHGLQKG